jgi:hypothetical protein
MKVRAVAIALIGLSLFTLAALQQPFRAAAAAGRLQDTETPPPTVESCLTLAPEDQSDCFATKAAIGEVQRQTQEIIDVTITAQAIEQNIQGTLIAAESTPTPQPTPVPPTSTPEGILLPIPGNPIELNMISIAGLAVCAVGGLVLVALGIYLVRGGGGREETEAAGDVATAEALDVRPLAAEAEPPALAPGVFSAPAPLAGPPEALATTVPGRAAALPPSDTTLAEHRLQAAAAPGMSPFLIAGDGSQVRVISNDFSVGRAFENDFVVDARFPGYENVSAEHARIVQDASQRWLVEDLGSANGTYVNGRPTTMNVLQDGWRVGFGPVEFTFRLIAPEETR